MNKSVKRFALGTLFAAAVGYIAGILTAPKSGKETRADIKHAAEVSIREAEKRLKQLHTQLNHLISEAQDHAKTLKGKAQKELTEAIGLTKLAKEKAREILSAVHEGDADDKELKKAIQDANKAIDHLKKYLGRA